MTVHIRLAAVGLDCADPAALAAFYSTLTGAKTLLASEKVVALLDDQPRIIINAYWVPDYVPPVWPGVAGQPTKQLHLDFAVDDLEAAQELALSAGASLADEQSDPEHHRVLLDPAGHPFCLTLNIPAGIFD